MTLRLSKPTPLMLALLAPFACGDDGMNPTGGLTTTMGPTVPSQATGESTSGDTPTSGGPGTTQVGTGSMGDSESSPTSTGDVSTTSTSGSSTSGSSTSGATSTGTTMTTGPATLTDPDTTTGSSGPACVCDPGSTDGCQGSQILTCTDDCLGYAPVPCPNGQSCVGGVCQDDLVCNPGAVDCLDENSEQTCNPQGSGYDPPVDCGMTEQCAVGQGCLEVCEIVKSDPSSVGCVFRASKMQNFIEEPTAVTIGNVSKTLTATVALYYFQNGAETMIGQPKMVLPGATAQFDLTMPPQPGAVSVLRPDSTFKIVSNVPVVAYQHSPIVAQAHNDSSMLLPDHAQQKNYIIAAYNPSVGGNPAYFNVVGIQDGTTVSWTPPVATQAGNGVPAVNANATGMVVVNDYDLLQVSSGQSDLSGTIVTLSKPGWVAGAVQCVNVPNNVTFCDHIEEQMIPIEYWGTEYVGAHAPTRGSEDYWWRVYASEDNTTVTTAPLQPGFPKVLNKGQFYEFNTKASFIFTGDKPFMPVQYLEGQDGGAGTGDPASYQMVPVEQFLDRYVFVTGIGYNPNYVQVVRSAGGPDVLVDNVVVNGYYAVGNYEVADWKINPGGHVAESAAQFGIYQVGYTGVTSYAYPGGLRLKVINPQ